MADNPWPLWSKPATKGDVIQSLAYTRRCVVDIYVCLSAMHRNDTEKLKEALEKLNVDDDKLGNLIDQIGGK